ncbi:MAG TPA: hypothetical protein VGG42_09850 [Acidobacteriaceae bacterium]|jgi:hypothetical protein
MAPITFRNSKIVYYGPHSCENCGVTIAKMGREWGGTAFTYPEGPIYPNTEWHPHVCDPTASKVLAANRAAERIIVDWPNAVAHQVGKLGYVVLGRPLEPGHQHGLVISGCSTFFDTDDAAWVGALRVLNEHMPYWEMDLRKYHANSEFSDDLDRLPECPTP